MIRIVTGLACAIGVCLTAPAAHGATTTVTCTGADDHIALQAAIDGFDVVNVTGAVCDIGATIEMKSDRDLVIDAGTEMRRGFAGNTGWFTALIFQADDNVKVNNVTIQGGVWTSGGLNGRVINWHGDNWTIDGINITSWGLAGSASRAITWVGDNAVIKNNHISGSPAEVGFGGVIQAGGDGAILTDNVITAGDDAIGFFPSASGILQDRDITNAFVARCTCNSRKARVIGAGLVQPTMTATVSGIEAVDITGTGEGKQSMIILDASTTTGAVHDMTFSNLTIQGSTTDTLHVVKVVGNAVSQITFQNLHASGARPDGEIVKLIDVGSSIAFFNSTMDATGAKHAFFSLSNLDQLLLFNAEFIGGSNHVVLINAGLTGTVSDVNIQNSTVKDIASNRIGINFQNAQGAGNPGACGNAFVTGTAITELSGATSTKGIRYFHCAPHSPVDGTDGNSLTVDRDYIDVN